MIDLPSWVRPLLKRLTCPYCKAQGKKVPLRKKGVRAIGIRECTNKTTHKKFLAFFFEHHCPVCKQSCGNILDASPIYLEDFIDDLISLAGFGEEVEEIQHAEHIEPKNSSFEAPPASPAEPSKISVKELDEYRKMINQCETHEEFMLQLGISKEDIEKYTFKRKPKGKSKGPQGPQ